MQLPQLNQIKSKTVYYYKFAGINRDKSELRTSGTVNLRDSLNMSGDNYPVLSTRKKRLHAYSGGNITRKPKPASNIVSKDGDFFYIQEDGSFVKNTDYINIYKNYYTENELSFDKNIKRQIILMGNYFVIFPDKIRLSLADNTVTPLEAVYYNINFVNDTETPAIQKIPMNTGVTTNEDGSYTDSNFEITGSLKYIGALDFSNIEIQKAANDQDGKYADILNKFAVGDYAEDTSSRPSTLYLVTQIIDLNTNVNYEQYDPSDFISERYIIFTPIYSYYVKIYRPGIGKDFNADDYITISEIINLTDEMSAINIAALNSSYKIYDRDDDYIIIKAEIVRSINYEFKIKVERLLPEMNFIVEHNNRLWGCNSELNEIYASKLGDPSNFIAYGDGISTDSYSATVGSEGAFTAVTTDSDSVIFFKENCVHIVYGTKPSNFTIYTYNVNGVEKGSEKSLQWFGDYLYYKSPTGVSAFYSHESTLISENIFTDRYRAAVAGKQKNKYYISMFNIQKQEYELYVYDVDDKIWYKEDSTRFTDTVSYNELMTYIDGNMGILCTVSDDVLTDSGDGLHFWNRSEDRSLCGEAFKATDGSIRYYGDINNDGIIDDEDVTLVENHCINNPELTGDDLTAADVNGDGSVNIKDATAIKKYVDATDTQYVKEDDFCFSFETGELISESFSTFRLKRIFIKGETAEDTTADLYVEYDLEGKWEPVAQITEKKKRDYEIAILPRRCEQIRLKADGRGEMSVFSIQLTFQDGGSRLERI